MSGRRETRVTVQVFGPPVLNIFLDSGPRRYRVTHVQREYYYGNGNWTAQRWTGLATIVKKDGTLGVATKQLPWNWAPDRETERQFIETAKSQLRRACDLQGRIA